MNKIIQIKCTKIMMVVALSLGLVNVLPAATTHYVDSAATGLNNGSSWTDAWTSPLNITSAVQPGDTVYISGGSSGSTLTYNLSTYWQPISGSSASRVIYQIGQDTLHNGTAIFNYTGGTPTSWATGADYITISGDAGDGQKHLRLTNYAFGINNVSHFKAEYIDATASGMTQFADFRTSGSPTLDIDLGYTSIKITDQNSSNAINVNTSLGLTWDAGCVIHHTTIDVPYRSNLDGFGADGIDQSGDGFTLHDCTIRGYSAPYTGGQHQDGWQGLGNSRFTKIYNNTIIDTTNYAFFGEAFNGGYSDVSVYNNIVMVSTPAIATNVGGAGIIFGVSSGYSGTLPCTLTNVVIANNMAVDYGNHSAMAISNVTATASVFTGCRIQNNVVLNSGAIDFTGNSTSTIDHNVVITKANGPTNFVSYTEFGGTGNDLHSKPTGPAVVDLGTDLSAFFSNDMDTADGVSARNKGQAWDVGPYELVQTTTSIVTQPAASQTVAAGGTATITVLARGQAPVTYQWKKGGINLINGGNVSGAISASLVLTNVSAADVATYTVDVNSGAGPLVASSGSSLNVGAGTAPLVTAQPTSQAVAPGANVTFTVSASGSPSPSFQWRKNGVNLSDGGVVSGSSTASLTLTGVTLGDAGTYSAVASNGVLPNATSIGAVLTVTVATVAPTITTQPSSQAVAPGANVTFTVAASGTPSPSFQWRKNGVNLTNGGGVSGATTASLTLTGVALGDAGTYTAVASNGVLPSATSIGAVLTVTVATVAPTITTQPATSQTAQTGNAVTFNVAASGSPTPTLQWLKNGIALTNAGNVSGATSNTLTLNNVTTADTATYTVVATNSAGTATSIGSVLTVGANILPAFTTQPTSVTLIAGGTASFSVVASGLPAPTIQWRINGIALANGGNVSGATTTTLTIANTTAADAAFYSAVATNSVGSAISNTGTLTVTAASVAPVILVDPVDQIVAPGASVVFTGDATPGLPAPAFQWRKNGVALANGSLISGVTTKTLTLASVTSADAGQYDFVVTNVIGSATSAAASLIVNVPPVTNQAPTISTQPVSKTAYITQSTFFSVTATALPAPSYQWSKDGVALSNGGNITGATSAVLNLSNLTAADAGSYTVKVSNTLGNVTSSAATLTALTGLVTISKQPASVTVSTGTSALFSSQATGLPAPTFQWQKSGVNLTNGGRISGATSNTLFLTDVTAADAGYYNMVATNSTGIASSDGALLTISGAPFILSQPSALTVVSSGMVVRLAVGVVGDPTPTIQWKKNNATLANGGTVSGATTATLTLTGVTAADAGTYSFVASNSQGNITSSNFELAVLPSNVAYQTVTAGKSTAISSPGATGILQWQVSSDLGNKWTDLGNDTTFTGVTTDTLRISNVSAAQSGTLFRLVSTSNGQTTVLRTATLNVAALLLPFPVALSADSLGNLYVADSSSDTIQKVDATGQVDVFAGLAGQTGTANGTGTTARFNDPSGIATATDGSMAVTDNANATIRLITSGGVVTTLAGSTTTRGNTDGTGTAATFNAPIGIGRDTAGNYYVADSKNHTIRKVTSAGVVTTFAGGGGSALSGDVDATGTAARFNLPTGIAVDGNGNVFVADTNNHLIRAITPAGVVTTLAGLGGVSGTSDGKGNIALFNLPSGLAIDPSGNLYVADTGNSTIRRITSAGVVDTIAGLPTISGLKDGVGVAAWFNQPRDVCINPNGSLYVADTGNAAIRQIDPSGTVTTLALTPVPVTTVLPLPTVPAITLPTPTVPAPLPTPTLPTTVTIPTASTSGGGGGGAPSLWFLGVLTSLWFVRQRQIRSSGTMH